MRKCKTKAIQENLGTFSHIPASSDRFMHNQTYPTIIQTYSKLYVILAYSEPTYIENTCTFRTRGILRVLAYSEPWHIQNQGDIQNPVKHLRCSVLRRWLMAINVFAISVFHILYFMK